MKNKALLEEIAQHAETLEQHLKRLNKEPEFVHELDIALLGENLKKIYNLVHSLHAVNDIPEKEIIVVKEEARIPMVEIEQNPDTVPRPSSPEISPPNVPDFTVRAEAIVADPEPVIEEVPETENVKEPDPDPEPEPQPTYESPSVPEPQSQKIEAAPVHDEAPIQPEMKEEEVETEEPKTTADLFSGATTIADSFQAEEDKSIAARVVPQGVTDLKMVIGINDKFLFINELFKGSPSEYNEAINSLNAHENGEDASTALNTYRQEYAWSDNSEAYHRLKKLILSKYSG